MKLGNRIFLIIILFILLFNPSSAEDKIISSPLINVKK